MPVEDQFRKAWAGPLCWRCAEEIALANLLDREGDIDRHRNIILVHGEPRQLTPTCWDLFALLYRHRGTVVSNALLGRQYHNLYRLRQVLTGSRYRIVNHCGVGYKLVVIPEHLC
jgi:DNA-binding response OmpR family regulator